LIQKEDQSDRPRVGVDVGATLAKIAQIGSERAPRFELLPATDLAAVARHVSELAPTSIGLTGGGAVRLAALLGSAARRVSEFDAWSTGAARLMAEANLTAEERYLLVSVGTGTSILLIDHTRALRVGGTALGGGTVTGLGVALIARAHFEELCRLAECGDHAEVNLLVSDIYDGDEIALPGDLTAASFGKLARSMPISHQGDGDSPPADPARECAAGGSMANPADLAAGIMCLVGENVALICAGLAAAAQVTRIVYGGTTLRYNPKLVAILSTVTTLAGREPCFLPHGEFTGAVGALELARD
jgi:type II pantothenate kinase